MFVYCVKLDYNEIHLFSEKKAGPKKFRKISDFSAPKISDFRRPRSKIENFFAAEKGERLNQEIEC